MSEETTTTKKAAEEEKEKDIKEVNPDEILFYYHPAENTQSAFFPGVPHDDLTREAFDALPDWVKPSIVESPMYKRSKPKVEEVPADEGDADKKDEGGEKSQAQKAPGESESKSESSPVVVAISTTAKPGDGKKKEEK